MTLTPGKLILAKDYNTIDPNFNNVSLLLSGEGANGSTTIIDSSNNNNVVTAVGDASISTTVATPFSATVPSDGVLAFDGTGDYLTVPDDGPFTMGSEDFTVECWVKLNNLSHTGTFITTSDPTDFQGIYFGHVNGVLYFLADINGTATWDLLLTNGSIPINTWTYVTGVRSGDTFTSYVNGNQVSTGTLSGSLTNTNNNLSIGGRPLLNQYTNGYLSNVRITKGVARYTANFTPPTQPFFPGGAN